MSIVSRSRVFILYNHHLFARGVESLLSREREVEVVGMERDHRQTLDKIRLLDPDVILVDSSTSPEASSVTIPEIFQKAPNARVISLSLRENGIDIYDKQHVIASGPQDLVRLIRRSIELESTVESQGAITTER
jgi:DNA-binding NarL/FixJ family response regulator